MYAQTGSELTSLVRMGQEIEQDTLHASVRIYVYYDLCM